MNDVTQVAVSGLPWLSMLIMSLPLGALLIWAIPNEKAARWIAVLTAILNLVLALIIVGQFDTQQPAFQLVERYAWIPSLNIHYVVGIDGLSALFLPLTVLLFIGVIVASWNSVQSMPRLYYFLLLLLESAVLGVFCALDTVLFFLFWELTLIPLYFLISQWGVGPNRRYAAVKYTLYMLAGGIPLLFGFILLAFNHAEVASASIPEGLSFDYTTLLLTPIPAQTEVLIFFLLFLGFAVKTPVVPLHTWLPVVATEGPVAVAALLTGLKLGVYGIVRFVVPVAPSAAQDFHWLLAGLGVVGILYGALAAMAQTNLRKMLAYSSISHVGLVLLGIASFNTQGIQGAIFQLLNFVTISGALFLLTGFLYHRVGSTDVISLGGVAKTMPLLSALFLFFGFASMGIPGTSGFPAELLILISALTTHTGAGLAALFGLVLGAAYFLGIYKKVFYGEISSVVVADAQDLRSRELGIIAVLAVLVLLLGFFPQIILDFTRTAADVWVKGLSSFQVP